MAAAKKRESKYLRAKTGKIRRYETAVFDLESKDGDSDQAGYTRPFLACFYDGKQHTLFRNAPHLRRWGYKKTPHLEEGGLIDRLMRHMLGMDLCGTCEVANEEALATGGPLELCPPCRHLRRRYSSARCRIFAHNGGRFDSLFVFPWLLRYRDRLRWEISGPESRIQRLEIWPKLADKKRLSWVIQDSVAILPMSLEQIGKKFLPEGTAGKMQHDLHMPEDDPRWDQYVKQDCTVLWHGVETLTTMVTGLGGEVGVTLPATAMNVYRRVFLDRPIHRSAHFTDCAGTQWDDVEEEDAPCHGCMHQWIRQGFYGGRTELFETSGHDVADFDLNSSYPASMMERMPAGRPKVIGPVRDLDVLRKLHDKHVGFVEATVWIPPDNPKAYKGDQRIPPLPVRFEGKLVFPVGRLRGVWSWDELELVLHPRVGGEIVETHRSVWYEAWPVFQGYVKTMYAYREAFKRGEGNEALDALAKLLLNSLFGKTGQKVERGKLIYLPLDDDKRLEVMDRARPLDGDPDEAVVWEEPTILNAPYIVPQLAAQVTTLSRKRLFLGMMSVLDQGGRVLYTDTDSIMCTGAVVQPVGNKLGQWKREYPDVLLDGTFILPKLYQLRKHTLDCDDPTCAGCKGSIQKMKGVPSRLHTPENFQKLMPKSFGGLGERLTFQRLTQHRTMIADHLESPEMEETYKTVRTDYDKRTLDRRDGSTKPLELTGGEGHYRVAP